MKSILCLVTLAAAMFPAGAYAQTQVNQTAAASQFGVTYVAGKRSAVRMQNRQNGVASSGRSLTPGNEYSPHTGSVAKAVALAVVTGSRSASVARRHSVMNV